MKRYLKIITYSLSLFIILLESSSVYADFYTCDAMPSGACRGGSFSYLQVTLPTNQTPKTLLVLCVYNDGACVEPKKIGLTYQNPKCTVNGTDLKDDEPTSKIESPNIDYTCVEQ